jgi:hypothetical protein
VTPPGVLAYHKGDEHHFIVPGRLEIELPPGRCHLGAERFEGYRLFPPNDVFTEAAHRQGGYVDAEKIVWRDVPNRQDVEFETDRWGMIPKWRGEFTTVAGMPLWAMATVKTASGGKLRVWVEAQSLRPLEGVEVIYRGKVVRSVRPPDTPETADTPGAPTRLTAEFDFTPDRDGWIAARAFERPGRTIRFSHTSPVYLERGVPASAADDGGSPLW